MNTFRMIIPILVVTLGSIVVAYGDSLVAKDDFVCQDTSVGLPKTARWPSVCLDSVGRIYEIQHMKLDDQSGGMSLIMNRFDQDGQLVDSGISLLPYKKKADSIWLSNSMAGISASETGRIIIPVRATLKDRSDTTLGVGVLLLTLDSSGVPLRVPSKVYLVPSKGNNFVPEIPTGDINREGLCVMAWIGRQLKPPLAAKVFVRLYDTKRDELHGLSVPSSLTLPISVRPHGRGRVSVAGPPCVAISDTGSFVVAWIAQWGHKGDVCYVVYNSAGNPVSSVRLANCQQAELRTDIQDCFTAGARTANMAGEADGDFYIAWSNSHAEAPDHNRRTHIWMRGFRADGSPKYPPVRVDDADSTNLVLEQVIYPAISCDNYGNVLVAWPDARHHSENHRTRLRTDVFVQRLDSTGVAIGPNLRINNTPGIASVKGVDHGCAVNSAGQAIVVWHESGRNSTIRAELMPLQQLGKLSSGNLERGPRDD